MKKLLFTLTFIALTTSGFSQKEIDFKEYTVTEFFKLIEDEPTDTLSLKNALILSDNSPFIGERYVPKEALENSTKQDDTLHIYKLLNLENVVFLPFEDQVLQHIVFHNALKFRDVFGFFNNIQFKEGVSGYFTGNVPKIMDIIFNDPRKKSVRFGSLQFVECVFDKDPYFLAQNAGNDNFILGLEQSTFKGGKHRSPNMILDGMGRILIRDNTFLGTTPFDMFLTSNNSDILIENNNFGDRYIVLVIVEAPKRIIYSGNSHKNVTGFSLPESIENIDMDWNQFKNGVINADKFSSFQYEKETKKEVKVLLKQYIDSVRIVDPIAYKGEIKLLGTLVSVYRRQFDMKSANGSYIALKDLETQRLEFIHQENPSFDSYFEWKVNQFLKVFSDYGTRPSKAITMSVYVILLFALIYLFFPNTWDSHGKNRIRDRFLFFHKYLRHPKGLHDVYLDEQKNELELANNFQQILEQHKTEVPKIFYQAAKPLHRWSVAGTMLFAKLLTKVDFLKGSWKQTDPKARVLKTSLTLIIFCIALIYDVFIKMLNALMLSINTFTTLGFGEIPIKGLPRYLAIIQGFIGWFMLTIFSVSLISQLLN